MSATLVTVAELIGRLSEYPPDMLVAVPFAGDEVEGNLDGPWYFEIVEASEVRSGWLYPPTSKYGADPVRLLVISDCGVVDG